MIVLHDFHRSSASFRIRIALKLKGIDYRAVVHDLDAGAHRSPQYLEINRQGLLPALEIGEQVLTQSAAILEHLDATYPDPPLLPNTTRGRARVRALFQMIASDTHPLTGMRVARYLKGSLGCDDATVGRWKRHWITETFTVLETMLAADPATGQFCHGDRPSLADIALVPQVVSARAAGVALEPFPSISRIFERCMHIEAFRSAHPDSCAIPTHA
ncbi:maleylacetoacetate isomerase [Trinickia diaoshuihuensis]|uniref:maleylacetoacetate isomerase n=1 Tax=Trinickia diaoshuihuensis TaxID=2292265 RepID=UPI000E276943|nr:maleylacetoacetate isomerase [Trinickia diaoshuihuensis]